MLLKQKMKALIKGGYTCDEHNFQKYTQLFQNKKWKPWLKGGYTCDEHNFQKCTQLFQKNYCIL